MKKTSNKFFIRMMIGLWFIAVMGGFMWLNWYKAQPGFAGKIPRLWPDNIPYERDPARFTLLLIGHPQCNCTKATLHELEKVLNQTHERLSVQVFFYHPEGTPESWAHSDLWEYARLLPRTIVYGDEAGFMARRFGAFTSGQTYLFSPEGDLMFAGGITASRGHIGDAQGQRSIIDVVKTGRPSTEMTQAFGCALFSAAEIEKYKIQIPVMNP